MESNPLVSVIIINFNGIRYLKSCFDALMHGAYKDIEIIFVDNGSNDQSYEFVKSNFSGINAIKLNTNLGLARASNIGAKEAKGKYFFFFNNDTIADKDLILELVKRLEGDSSIGICGCRTLTYNGAKKINCGVPMDIFGYPFGFAKPFYVDAAIFIRRNVFEEIGGFDEEMFLYGEDRDLCWRVRLYGYKVVVEPKAYFFHDSACVESNLKKYKTNIRKRFLGEFNALRSILKNYSLISLIFILPAYIFINLFEIIFFIFTSNLNVVKDVYIKSYVENLKLIKDMQKLRREIQKRRMVSDWDIIKDMQKISGKLLLLIKMGLPKVN